MFYKGTVAEEVAPKRYPPPTRYQSYTPKPKSPDPPMDFSTRPNRSGESLKKPDPAWGYTGHEFARRFDAVTRASLDGDPYCEAAQGVDRAPLW